MKTTEQAFGDRLLDVHQEARVLWIMVGGTLAGAFLQRMGALPHRIMKQGTLPSQLNLAKHIVQATVRVAAAEDASSAQLQQLLWFSKSREGTGGFGRPDYACE